MKLLNKFKYLIISSLWIIPVTALAQTSLDNPLTGSQGAISPEDLSARLINGALGFVGVIALIMFIYGGFVWLTSAGSAGKVSKGKNIMIWAILGIVVIFFSYAILNTVFGILGSAGSGN